MVERHGVAMNDSLVHHFYSEIDLGKSASSYVVENVLSNGLTYARLLAKRLPTEAGKLSTFLPNAITANTMVDFRYSYRQTLSDEFLDELASSGLIQPNIDPIDEYYVLPLIRDFLAEDSQHLCIIEDHDGRFSDGEMKDIPAHAVHYQEEIYLMLSGADMAFDRILDAFGWIVSWSFICALTSFPTDYGSPLEIEELSIDHLEMLANRTDKLIVSAYDGEGYVIWHRG